MRMPARMPREREGLRFRYTTLMATVWRQPLQSLMATIALITYLLDNMKSVSRDPKGNRRFMSSIFHSIQMKVINCWIMLMLHPRNISDICCFRAKSDGGIILRITSVVLGAWLFALTLIPLSTWAAKPTLLLHPTMVMFEGRSRTASIYVVNRGDAQGTFVVSWMDLSMTPEGGLRKMVEPPAWSLQPHIRYSPRRMTLAPGETQLVKVALRRNNDVPKGEYYSHFKVLTLSSETAGESSRQENDEVKGSVNVVARSAMAIPVIWRNSKAEPRAVIESVKFSPAGNLRVSELQVGVRRLGKLSVRGFLHVVRPGADDTEVPLSDPVPLVMYPTVDLRTVPVRLQSRLPEGELEQGVTVIYASSIDLEDKETRLASFRY